MKLSKKTLYIGGALILKKILLLSLLSVFYAEASQSPAPPTLNLPPPTYTNLPQPAPSGAKGLQTYGSGLPLPEFLRITLGDMMQRSYVLSPDVATSSLTIAADLSHSKLKDPLPLVRQILAGQNLVLKDIDGVLFVERKATDAFESKPSDTIIYRPRNRSIGSLSSYFSLFPNITFSYGAGINVRSQAPSTAGAAQPDMSAGATTFNASDRDPSFLVAKGPISDLSSFQSLLNQLDVPVPEVMLRAYVFEVRDTDNKGSAVQLVASVLGDRLGLTLGATGSGDSLRLSLPNFGLAVSSLTSDSRVRLVSSPTLRAADGTTASATIGTDTPTLGSIVTSNGSSQQSVSYQSAGVLLSVSPRILDETIRLTISQELSSFVKTDTGLSDTPTKLRRAFKSDVIARDGEAILLGGLSEAQQSDSNSGSFSFFGSKSSNRSSSEIVVLLKVERL